MSAFINPLGLPRPQLRAAINQKPLSKMGPKTTLNELRDNPDSVRAGKVSQQAKMTSRGRGRRKGGSGDSSSSSSSSSSGDDFNNEVERSYFFDESRTECVTFDFPLKSPLSSKPIDDSSIATDPSSFINNPKLEVGLAAYKISTSTEVQSNLLKDVYHRLSRKIVQDSRGSIINSWTFDNFLTYQTNLIRALSVFYTIDSIISYSTDKSKSDKNDVNYNYQTKLIKDFDIISEQNRLRRLLKGYAFPSKYSQLIRWTYQLYKDGPLNQSTNYRFVPDWRLVWTTTDKDIKSGVLAIYAEIFASLETDIMRNISAIISRSHEAWEIRGLPLSCGYASYDRVHHEMWVNQPLLYATTDPEGPFDIYPSTNITGGTIPWGSSFPNGEVPALPSALTCVYTDDDWSETSHVSGIFKPLENEGETSSSRKGNVLVWFQYQNRFEPITSSSSTNDLDVTGLINVAGYNATTTGEIYSKPSPGMELKYFRVPDAPLIDLRTMYNWMHDLD